MSTRPLRVLRLTPAWLREGVWPVAFDPVGGLQTQVSRLTEELDKQGISQTVLTSYIPGLPRRTKIFGSTVVWCVGIRIPESTAGNLLNLSWFIAACTRMIRWRRKFDLVHIHYNHSMWCRVLVLVAHALKLPAVVSLSTELWISSASTGKRSISDSRLAQYIERMAMLRSDAIIALTKRSAKHWTTKTGLQRDQIKVIPDAIDSDAFTITSESASLAEFRHRHSIPLDQPVISFIGRIRHEKGWENLPAIIQGISVLDGFLLICGDGPDRKKLEAALVHAGVSQDQYCITGFLGPDGVKLAFEITDVLILPSRREVFGGVLLEAMAFSVPVVANATGGIVEVVGTPAAIRLVEPNDTTAFYEAVLELLSNKHEYAKLVVMGRKRVLQFSLSQTAHSVLTCYSALTAEP